MILLLDNYDSFTFNLFHLVSYLTEEPVEVRRNNRIEAREAAAYSRIILSPGPGLPDQSGTMPEVINTFSGRIPMLGVCLGHQALGVASGGKLINLQQPYHGVSTEIMITEQNDWLFEGLPHIFMAGRYHSWVLDASTISKPLKITAKDKSGNVMGVSDDSGRLKGIQFHPESIMTGKYGERILANWLRNTAS